MSERDVDAVSADGPVQIVLGVLEIRKKRDSMRRSVFPTYTLRGLLTRTGGSQARRA
jgi:hypothetical protein